MHLLKPSGLYPKGFYCNDKMIFFVFLLILNTENIR